MSYELTVDVIGNRELEQAFRDSPSVTKDELSKAIMRTAFRVESRAKANAPVQYGTLRGSINVQGPITSRNNVEAKVGTNVKYAPYQEYGTGIYAGNGMIRPKRARVLAWKKNGKWIFARAVKGVKGKFYFKKAREESKDDMVSFMQEALGNIISHLARG